MKKSLILLCLFACTGLLAQTPALYMSADSIINMGIALNDEGKYDDALACYNRVNPNDELYGRAMYEKALTWSTMKKHDVALAVLDSIKPHLRYPDAHYYNLLGSTLDDLGRNAEALEVYAKAYPKYTNTYLLPYNYAFTLYRARKFDEAEAVLETSIRINPYHFNSHITLGRINYAKGRLIPALMCFSFASNIAGSDQLIYDALMLFDRAIDGQLALTIEQETNSPVQEASATDELNQQFAELDFAVRSNIARSNKFKPITKIDLSTTRQTQLMIENIKMKTGAADIYNRLYASFFQQIQQEKHTEGYIYCMMRFSNKAEFQKIYTAKKNKAKLEAYASWAGHFIDAGREKLFNPVANEVYTFNRTGIESRGAYTGTDRKEKTGRWTYYASNGVRESEGEYVHDLKQGPWTYCNQDGNMLKACRYKDNQEDGTTVFYHSNGVLSEKSFFSNDKREGTAQTFNTSGNLDRAIDFKNGMYSGPYIAYFDNGRVKESAGYLENRLNGAFKSFYANGKPEVEAVFKDDQPDGIYTVYYENGKISHSFNYKGGVQYGQQKEWYADGTIRKACTTDDEGELDGVYLYYHPNGVLSDSITYSNGKESGKGYSYDTDGKLYYVIDYLDGVKQTHTQYDKSGKVIGAEDCTGQHKTILYYPDGTIYGTGMYSDGKKEGLWTMYDASGAMEQKIRYRNDDRDGEFLDYFGNGKLYERTFYSAGKQDGFSVIYSRNGKPLQEGYYQAGKPVGLWKTYYPDGQLSGGMYHGSDEQLNGCQVYYTCDGKKEHEEIYENGYFNEFRQFDAEGNLSGSSKLENGNGLLHITHPNGKTSIKVHVMGGKYNDTLTMYNINGVLLYRCNFVEGQKDGLCQTFNDDGLKVSETVYILGKEHGTGKGYNSRGQMVEESEYLLGQLIRKTNFHDNGAKAIEHFYSDRQRNGISSEYDDDGLLICNYHFRSGVLSGYSCTDASGKTVEKAFDKGSGDLAAWYSNGMKSIEARYVNGWEEGLCTVWHSNGKKAKEINYVNGCRDGEYKSYSRTGVLLRHSFYRYDELYGPSKSCHPNGQPAFDENFRNGLLHGICKYYDTGGRLKYTRVYDNGRLISETR